MDISFRVKIKGLNKVYPERKVVVTIPVGSTDNKLAVLKPTSSSFYGTNLQIKVHECEKFASQFYPKEINDKYSNQTLSLEDVFNIGTEAEAELIVLGYDEFSGARKYFSKIYTSSNIVNGQFQKRSMKIEMERNASGHSNRTE